ncbi:ABC1 kinase family protein [Streptomyces sp. NPDC087270]|uniref:ABC1 kinase family protein n=1 Tax=Streptomyces sp. NPDC087270 TaxID=3365774 RepID=UPI003810435F
MAGAIRNRLRTVTGVLGALLVNETRKATREHPDAERRRAVAVRDALEQLGPFYIKLGQMMATRPDLARPALAAELEHLHDKVEALPFYLLEPVLEQDLGPDWKLRFDDLDTVTPLGTASIAQVHRATLSDGRPAVVKIQRPGIRDSVAADMALMRRAARLLGRAAPRFSAVMDLDAMLGSLFDAMEPELDFTGEAANMDRARDAIGSYRTLRVPEVLHATPRVLVQSLADGESIRHVDRDAIPARRREEICKDLLRFMYRGYFVDRFFHADPHPGNVFVSTDGRATLIDWGMVGRIDKRTSMHLALVLMAMARNDGYSLANAWTAMGHATPWADLTGFASDMAALTPRLSGASLDQLNFGGALTSVLEKASRRGIASAPSTSLLGKSFGNLEGSVRHLYPGIVVGEVFKTEVNGILRHMLAEYASPQQLAANLTELLLGSTAALEQWRAVANDGANRDLTVRMLGTRLPRARGGGRSPSAQTVVTLTAAAYLLGRRRTGPR